MMGEFFRGWRRTTGILGHRNLEGIKQCNSHDFSGKRWDNIDAFMTRLLHSVECFSWHGGGTLS